MKKEVVFMFFFLMVLSSCQRLVTIENVNKVFDDQFSINTRDYQYILVVPQNGCSNCVQKSYEFISSFRKNSHIKFVFTHYSSQKAVKIRMRVLGIDEIVDELSFIPLREALDAGFSHLYPTLISVDDLGNGRVTFMNKEDGSDWVQLQNELKAL